jgi:hypothetical protein
MKSGQMKEIDEKKNEQIDIQEINGRTQITFKKAILKGKVSQNDLLNTIFIAAKMQGEYLVKKLSRGAPLDNAEVKQLKDLAEIAKLDIQIDTKQQNPSESIAIEGIKSALYLSLTEKLKSD